MVESTVEFDRNWAYSILLIRLNENWCDNFFNRLSREKEIVIQIIDRYPLKTTKINNLSVLKEEIFVNRRW